MVINCLNPQVIISPNYRENVLFFDEFFYSYYLGDVLVSVNRSITPEFRKRIYFDGESFFKVFDIPYQTLDYKSLRFESIFNNCYFYNIDTGETADFYKLVPCQHCDICNAKRESSLSQRCLFQSLQDSVLPVFCTLTYNNAHLPFDGVCKRHIQLFKKRLNRFVSRWYKCKLKYFVVSEYGKLGRPHYHMIIFGLPCFLSDDELELMSFCSSSQSAIEFKQKERVTRLLSFFWREPDSTSYLEYCNKNYQWFNISPDSPEPIDFKSFGYVNAEVVSSGNVTNYVMKYVSKGSNVPDGKNPNFRLISQNMGIDFVESNIDSVLDSTDHKLVYNDNGKLYEVSLCSYYLSRFLPSVSQSLNAQFKRAIIYLHYHLRQLLFARPKIFHDGNIVPMHIDFSYKEYLINLIQELYSKFPNYTPFSIQLDSINPRLFDYDKFNDIFKDSSKVLEDYGNPFIDYALAIIDAFPDFETCIKLSERRIAVLSSMDMDESNIAIRSAKYRENKTQLKDKAFLD